MNIDAIKDLAYKMADDQLIIGHRHSEWIGLGPLLEEDIAFASKAQDKVGQSLAFYKLLEALGGQDPDTLAFGRTAAGFHNAIFAELPNGEFDFSIIRHFLFDTAEFIRFEMLAASAYQGFSNLGKKFKGEVQYHILHANEWLQQLGNSDDKTIARMQNTLDYALPYALGVFEPSKWEEALLAEGIFAGERELQARWEERVHAALKQTGLTLPSLTTVEPVYGGRYGQHSEHLQPLLDEMGEVINSEPGAEW